MANPDSIALAASAEAEGLESVLVGGNAVNLHAYLRTTFDVDLLVRESESERWLSFFEQHGYTVFHRSRNFTRLRFADDPTAALPVDLMLADAQTFSKIRGESRRCDIGKGLNLFIASPLHLIAMKLHALRSRQRLETEPESSTSSVKNRVREDSGMLDLPEFDSLPATAGLNTTEAFQLSIRHALALLPALFARGMGDRIPRVIRSVFPSAKAVSCQRRLCQPRRRFRGRRVKKSQR